MRALPVCLALGAALICVTPYRAAAAWPPEFLVNIKALPQDISVGELSTTMRGFAGALGVRCTHCHEGEDSDDLTSMDFVSDAKIEKQKAREMIRMVRRINEELLAAVPGRSDPPVVVACRTCHRSLTRPAEIRDVLAATLVAEGAEAAIAHYQQLRDEYYGSDSYDFRPFVLANVGEKVASQDPEGALRLLEFNAELHPDSGMTFATMARIYRSMSDVEGTIRSLERAIAAEPENEAANEFYRGVIQRLREQQ